MRTDREPADFFYQLDDPAFLAERARLRSRLEHVPENSVGRPRLERLYEAMTEEFCRRARIAWHRGRLPAHFRQHWSLHHHAPLAGFDKPSTCHVMGAI
jgi:hypothetical protein